MSEQTGDKVRIAGVLAEHQWSISRGSCWCGWTPVDAVMALSSIENQFIEHQAEQVCLPTPDAPTDHDGGEQ